MSNPEAQVNTLALLQARMSSSRLPGKSLFPILGQPMLFRQLARLGNSRKIDRLVVVTSTDPSDDALAEACHVHGTLCFRGSLHDVLDRFVQAAMPLQPKTIVRLTGDCPLTDAQLIDAVIDFFRAGNYDYASNCLPPTFPDGLDVEVMRYDCLLTASDEATLPSHREHVTPFLRADPDRFRLGNFASATDLSSLRWTVDEPEDFEFVCRVYEKLYPTKPDFSTRDVLDLLQEEPSLQRINLKFQRNEGTKNSLAADADFLAGKNNVRSL